MLESPRTWSTWERRAALVWAVAFVVVCVRVLLSRPRSHDLYPIFAEAGRRWADGQPLYRLENDPFRYGPPVAAMFVPFGWLADRVGSIAWRAVSLAAFLAGFRAWSRDGLSEPIDRDRRAMLLLLAAPLSIGNLNNGQANLVVLGALLGAAALVRCRRMTSAAVCLALAVGFKIYPIAVALLLVSLFPLSLGPRLAIALAAIFAVPFAIADPAFVTRQFADWLAHIHDGDTSPRDVRLLLFTLGVSPSDGAFLCMQLATAAALPLLLLAGRRAGRSERKLLALAVGLGCAWITLFVTATESPTYVLIAPTLAWVCLEAFTSASPWAIRCLAAGAYALLAASAIGLWSPAFRDRPGAAGAQPLAALLLVPAVLHTGLKRESAEDTSGLPSPRDDLAFRATRD